MKEKVVIVRGVDMKVFKVYATDLTKTYVVLTKAGYYCIPTSQYVRVHANESQKLKLIKLLNESYIVLLDIE